MRRLILVSPLLTMACIVPPYTAPKDTDASTDAAVNGGDTDSDAAQDTDAAETGDTSLTPTDGAPGDTDLPQGDFGCHNYDPVEGTGWVRKYDLHVPSGHGVEKDSGLGHQTLPTGTAAAITDGWAYEVVITKLPKLNSDSTYYDKCGVGGDDGAFEIGFTQVNTKNANFPLKAGAQTARKYLPDELSMHGVFGANPWHVTMKYDMKVPQLDIIPNQHWAYNGAKLSYDGDVTPIAFETINVPALGGNVDAYHVNYTYTMQQTNSSGGFFGIFNQLFAPFTALFGFQGSDLSVSAVADQWYVRGVGLVKEEVYQYPASTHILIREKNLTSCSGLPDCP